MGDIDSVCKEVSRNTADIKALSKLVLGNGERGMDEVQRATEELVKTLSAEFKAFVQQFNEYKTLQEAKELDILKKALDEKIAQEKDIIQKTYEYNRQKKLIIFGAVVSNVFIILGSIFVWLLKIAPVLEAASK